MASIVTLVPAVLAALPGVFATALTGMGAPVRASAIYDGTPDTGDMPAEFAAVGYAEDRPCVMGATALSDIGNRLHDDTFSVWNVISVAKGSPSDTDPTVRCAAMLAAVVAGIEGDPTLGGAIPAPGYASLGQYEWVRGASGMGSYVSILFTVHIESRAI